MQGALSLDEENWDASIHLISVSSLVRMSEPRFRQESRHLPFGTVPTRPARLHSGTSVACRNFHGVSNALLFCRNPKCGAEFGAQFYDIATSTSLLTHAPSIGDQHPTGKQELKYVVQVGSSCTEVVLNGMSTFPECFNPSCHCAIW